MITKVFKNHFAKQKVTVLILCMVCAVFLITAGCRENAKIVEEYDVEEQEVNVKSATEIWDYPVKPGMEQWRQFKNMNEMFQACQIPENILNNLDTKSLVQICYNFPAYNSLFFYNSPQAGFNAFHLHFNGIRELLKREDAGIYMLEKYNFLSVSDFDPSWSLVDQGYFSYKYQYFEILLAQPQLVQSLDAERRKLFVKEAVQKLEMKLSLNKVFGGGALMINAWLLAKLLHYDNNLTSEFYKPDEIDASLQSGMLVNYSLMTIYQQAKSYLNE